MKHKHAELIKAWVDGAEVQYRWKHWHSNAWEDWRDLICLSDFNDAINFEYRLKPEPRPDYCRYIVGDRCSNNWYEFSVKQQGRDIETMKPQIRIIFDGETGELKSAEVIK